MGGWPEPSQAVLGAASLAHLGVCEVHGGRRGGGGGGGSARPLPRRPRRTEGFVVAVQSVPEVDPATTMPRSQSQPRTSSGSSSAPQAPALSAAGPITANSEQVRARFGATGAPAAALGLPGDRGDLPRWAL